MCKFDINQLGDEDNEDDECTHQNEFGYEDGRPCVLLKLNKVRTRCWYEDGRPCVLLKLNKVRTRCFVLPSQLSAAMAECFIPLDV